MEYISETERRITLPVGSIVIDITVDRLERPIGGSITSKLKEGHKLYDACMDAIESMVLAHAMAEVKVESAGYIEGLETAIVACAGNYF